MNLIVCTFAAFLHYTLRLTAFVEPFIDTSLTKALHDANDTENNSISASLLPSTMVFLAICIMVADANIIPDRYSQRASIPFRMMVELIAAFMLIEFGMILVWTRLEQLVEFIVFIMCFSADVKFYTEKGGDALTTSILLALALAFLVNTIILTDVWTRLCERSITVWHERRQQIVAVWHKRTGRSMRVGQKSGASTAMKMQGAGDGMESASKSAAQMEQKSSVKKKYLCLICEKRDC